MIPIMSQNHIIMGVVAPDLFEFNLASVKSVDDWVQRQVYQSFRRHLFI